MDKALPHNLDAERSVLGAVLMNRDALTAVYHWLPANDFFFQPHAWIYEAMRDCYERRTPPDLRTVSDELRRRERLGEVGGVVYLNELVDYVPTSSHIEYYARIVQQTALRRRLIGAGGKLAALGYDEARDLDETIVKAYTTLDEATKRASDTDLMPVGSAINAIYEAMDEGTPPGQPTYLYDYDRMTGGLHAGRLVVIAARPAVGKSALALTIGRNLAKAGEAVGMFSLEMTREECTQRLVAMEAGVDSECIRDRTLSPEDMSRCLEAMGRVHQWPFYIDETPGLSVEAMRAKVLRWVASNGPLRAVIVDHMQLATAPGFKEEYDVVTHVSKKLKELAKQANTTVLALSQLSRAVEGRATKEPTLADLRASGAIEQDADQVMFIYRAELYDPTPQNAGQAKLLIRKHRNGRTGDIDLQFNGPTMEFRTPDRFHDVEGY